jgi:FHA domain
MANNPFSTPAPGASEELRMLPADTDSLARRIPYATPAGTLCVLGPRGGVQAYPGSKHVITFGRAADDVDVALGTDDPAISRVHGEIAYDGRKWRLTNTGLLPIRFPGSDLLLHGHDEPLSRGYTPLFIKTDTGGADGREHILEILVTKKATPAAATPRDGTAPVMSTTEILGSGWSLNDIERLILVSLAQRYLRHSPRPQPQSWKAVVDELIEVAPEITWTEKMVQGRVLGVRRRLCRAGVEGLRSDEVKPPIGNAINHNLIIALLSKAVLTPQDLQVLDVDEAAAGPRPA